MLRLYLDESVSSEDFKRFNDPLVEQRTQLDEDLGRLQAEIDVLRIDSLSGEQLISEALHLHSRWPSMGAAEKRQIIEQRVRSIKIGDGDIEFNLVQLPAYQEIANWQNTYPHAHTAVRSSTETAVSEWP